MTGDWWLKGGREEERKGRREEDRKRGRKEEGESGREEERKRGRGEERKSKERKRGRVQYSTHKYTQVNECNIQRERLLIPPTARHRNPSRCSVNDS